MSGSTDPAASFAATPLTDAEKVSIRRYCWYQTYGGGNSGFNSWRFFTEYGLLEYRMNNLAPAELQNVRERLAAIFPVQTALDSMYANLQVSVAAAFTRNPKELADRRAHLAALRVELCDAVGVPPGPLRQSSVSRPLAQ